MRDRTGAVFDLEEEVGRDQHGLDRQLNSLLRVLPLRARERDESHQSGDLLRRGGAAIGVVGEVRHDALHAGGSRLGIANQDLLAAGVFRFGGVGSDEGQRIDKLVLLTVVQIGLGDSADEIVVEEAGAEGVLAFGKMHAHVFFGIRIEVDELGRLGFD